MNNKSAISVMRAKVAGLVMMLTAMAGMVASVPPNSVDVVAGTLILLGGVGIGTTGSLILTDVDVDE